MKQCPNCHNQLDDSAAFCPYCGANLSGGAAPYYYAPPKFDPYDHTSEFDAQDISDHKLTCMLVYLLDIVGVIVALLAGSSSKYTAFHVRQSLKFTVVEALLTVIVALLCWTVVVPIIGAVMLVILFVLKFICFFQVCKGQAKEPSIIRNLDFLK